MEAGGSQSLQSLPRQVVMNGRSEQRPEHLADPGGTGVAADPKRAAFHRDRAQYLARAAVRTQKPDFRDE